MEARPVCVDCRVSYNRDKQLYHPTRPSIHLCENERESMATSIQIFSFVKSAIPKDTRYDVNRQSECRHRTKRKKTKGNIQRLPFEVCGAMEIENEMEMEMKSNKIFALRKHSLYDIQFL